MKVETHKEITHTIEISQEELTTLLKMCDLWVMQANKLPSGGTHSELSVYGELLDTYKRGAGTNLSLPFEELAL